jgi:hypothetical protein
MARDIEAIPRIVARQALQLEEASNISSSVFAENHLMWLSPAQG